MQVTITPNTLDAETVSFIQQLISDYPLMNIDNLPIQVTKTKNKTPYKAWCGEEFGVRLSLTLGAVYDLAGLHFIIAHEYAHAMQSDQKKCTCDKNGAYMCEIDADLFAIQVTSKYTGRSIEDLLRWVPIYKQTKEHINNFPSLQEAINNIPEF